jgi:circadian clock protein KaiB
MNEDPTEALRLRLYVAGDAPNSIVAVAHLRAVIAECANGRADLEIIDILRDPERGLRDGVFVTPMLVKVAPPPERRVLGSLSDRRFLLAVLGLDEPPLE